ncbi:MAG: response regulator [Desulfarculaceae bacterium]|nr:response regulator [Desulfarculaceae bacterium]
MVKRKLQFFRDMDVSAKLNFGFGSLLALMILIITLCFYTVYMAHSDITRSVEEFYPVTREVGDLQQKLWSMILKERAYLVLGGQIQREDFRRAEERFSKQFDELKEMVTVKDYEVLKKIGKDFQDWQGYSDEVFELRQKPVENYPALGIYNRDVQSLRVSVSRYIRTLQSKIEGNGTSGLTIQLLGALLEYKNSLEKALSNLKEYAKTGGQSSRYVLDSYLDSTGGNLDRLVSLGKSSDADIANLVESIRTDYEKIVETVPGILEIAGSEKRSKAVRIFRDRITPLANTMIDTLEGLNRTKRDQLTGLLENTNDQLELLEKIIILTALLAAVISFLSIWAVFNTLTKPVRTLTDTAESIARGNFYTRCELSTKDELGRLAKSFNTMTSRLQGTISKLENHRLYLKEMVDEQTVEVRRSREELEENRHRLQRLLDNLPGGMAYRCDNNRNYTMSWISKGALYLTGYAPGDLVDDRAVAYGDLIHPDDRDHVWEKVQAGLEQREPFHVEYRIRTADGAEKWVLEKGVGVYTLENELVGLEGIISDITEQKEAEKEMIAAREQAAEQDKNALIGQVAGKMAHDFNNILAGIMGNAELSLIDCREKDAAVSDVVESLELICDLTERGKSLTRNLIAFARDQEIKQEYVNINETIDFVLNLLRNELETVRVVKNLDENIPRVLADASMIEHMLVNLVQNSIHAMGKVDSPLLTVTTSVVDGTIQIEIEDNGCGIPQEHAREIYTPSFTLKGSRDSAGVYQKGVKGTGYGMSNVKKYVEKHKGNIAFESTAGAGTRFTVQFPVTRRELSAEEIRETVNTEIQAERRILLVEDEEIISRMQKHILEKEPLHHRVDIASDGQEAVRLFEENEYDLVSLDFVLPGDFVGMDVYSHIREKNSELPILFISGNLEFIESINRIREVDDRVDHLSKPCRNTDYVSSINRLLQRNRSRL